MEAENEKALKKGDKPPTTNLLAANLSRSLKSKNRRGSPTVNINVIRNQTTALVNIQSQPDASQANINPLTPYSSNMTNFGMSANVHPNFPAAALVNPHQVGTDNLYQLFMPPYDAGVDYYRNMHPNEFMLQGTFNMYPHGYYANMVHKPSHENDVKVESNVKSESFE